MKELETGRGQINNPHTSNHHHRRCLFFFFSFLKKKHPVVEKASVDVGLSQLLDPLRLKKCLFFLHVSCLSGQPWLIIIYSTIPHDNTLLSLTT